MKWLATDETEEKAEIINLLRVAYISIESTGGADLGVYAYMDTKDYLIKTFDNYDDAHAWMWDNIYLPVNYPENE